ncbi:hypothetical protein [Photobacterium kishitanii]|uniref:Uncharacterized protein n=1 Tax=Photobacterium kishitanii TaxID=318456 RepID=A0A2T3KKW2_9GAMM|nr:hypothetical protein [Photobacterium kishitanii]PSV00331.1 hypothetical protein C9J27_04185 [Photobacterium kishitanii]
MRKQPKIIGYNGGQLELTAYNEDHIFIHTGTISSQMNPKSLVVKIIKLMGKRWVEISDTVSGYREGFAISDSRDVCKIRNFMMSNYQHHILIDAAPPHALLDNIVQVSMSGVESKPDIVVFIEVEEDEDLVVLSDSFYGVYPVNKTYTEAKKSIYGVYVVRISSDENTAHVTIETKQKMHPICRTLSK